MRYKIESLSLTPVLNAAKQNKWDSQKGHSPLSLFVKSVLPNINNEVLKYIDDHSFHYTVRKGAHIVRSSTPCSHLFLITKGAFRAYIKEGRHEVTTWICIEGEIITSIKALTSREDANENIQAIEDADLVGASIDDLYYLYEHYPQMNIVGRKILERYYLEAEERSFIGRILNATNKYTYFLRTKPILSQRILLKYIASYLGIKMETLSRIRGKMSKQVKAAE